MSHPLTYSRQVSECMSGVREEMAHFYHSHSNSPIHRERGVTQQFDENGVDHPLVSKSSATRQISTQLPFASPHTHIHADKNSFTQPCALWLEALPQLMTWLFILSYFYSVSVNHKACWEKWKRMRGKSWAWQFVLCHFFLLLCSRFCLFIFFIVLPFPLFWN